MGNRVSSSLTNRIEGRAAENEFFSLKRNAENGDIVSGTRRFFVQFLRGIRENRIRGKREIYMQMIAVSERPEHFIQSLVEVWENLCG